MDLVLWWNYTDHGYDVCCLYIPRFHISVKPKERENWNSIGVLELANKSETELLHIQLSTE